MTKVIRVAHTHRTVIVWRGRNARERTLLSIQLATIAHSSIVPGSLSIGHETHTVHTLSVVKAIDVDNPVLVAELRAKLHIQERIPLRESRARDLGYTPPFDRLGLAHQ